MRIRNLQKIVLLILWVFGFSHIHAAVVAADDLPSRTITFRVYHLHSTVDIEEALKENDGEHIEYTHRACRINPGCTWVNKPKTITTPHFWNIIEQGIGQKLVGEEDSERNKGEHWVYDIPAGATDCGQHFAVVLGMGEFFKTEEITRPNEKGEAYEDEVIGSEYGEQDFGYQIVQNLVEDPVTGGTRGRLHGKPFNKFCAEIKGSDFCSLTMRIASPKNLLDVCERLWRFRNYGSRELYRAMARAAEIGGQEVGYIPETSFASRPTIGGAKAEEEEGKEFDVTVINEKKEKVQKKAVMVFGRLRIFEGFEEFIEQTNREIRALMIEDPVDLPKFDRSLLRDEALDVSVEEEEEDEGKTGPSTKKKKPTDWEGRYNRKTALEKGYLLLDKKCVENIEVCDLWARAMRQLVHIKIGTDTAVLNHLFGQGYASATLLAREDFSEKMILDLIRKEIVASMETLVRARFADVKEELWDRFKAWRERNKEKLASKDNSKKGKKLQELIAQAEEKRKDAKEFKAALEALYQTLKGDDKEELRKILDGIGRDKTAVEDEINAFLKGQLEKADKPGVLETKVLPEDKKVFAEFCAALKPFVRDDADLNTLLNELTLYRTDLIEAHLLDCWNKHTKDMRSGPLDAYFKLTRPSALKASASPVERTKAIFQNILAKYKAKKTHHQTAKTCFSEEDLQRMLEDKEILALYETLWADFIISSSTSSEYQVVYGIITDKDPSKEVLPLGARINLLRVARDLEALTGKKKFKPLLQIIPNITKGEKPKESKKGATSAPATITLASTTFALPKPSKPGGLPGLLLPAAPKHFIRDYLRASVMYGSEGNPLGLPDHFTLCPTRGDGDCFFHAILTEAGEDLAAVTHKAAGIRDSLGGLVSSNPGYIDILRRELLGQYGQHFRNNRHDRIPIDIYNKLMTNEQYVIYRQSILDSDIDIPIGHPLQLIKDNPHPPFTYDAILADISDEEILGYVGNYRSEFVGQEKAFIEIPTGRDMASSLGEIICRAQDVYVHCFLYDQKTGTLNFKGSIGNPASAKVRYVLQHASHYWALYRDDFLPEVKARIAQIERNAKEDISSAPSLTVLVGKRPRPPTSASTLAMPSTQKHARMESVAGVAMDLDSDGE